MLPTGDHGENTESIGGDDGERDECHHTGQFRLQLPPGAGQKYPTTVKEYDRAEDENHELRAGECWRRTAKNFFKQFRIDQNGDGQQRDHPKFLQKRFGFVAGVFIVFSVADVVGMVGDRLMVKMVHKSFFLASNSFFLISPLAYLSFSISSGVCDSCLPDLPGSIILSQFFASQTTATTRIIQKNIIIHFIYWIKYTF